MKTKEDYLKGQLILIDKPLKWSSFQAVNAVKWAIRKKYQLKKIKVGHAGTLDPLASGLLLICVGKFTKRIHEFQEMSKVYEGTITLGSSTPSYDLETEIDKVYPTAHITNELIYKTKAAFIGKIAQKPPVFSALKKDGKRMYEYAREGKELEVKARFVEILEFEILEINMPDIHFRIQCSKGTYIRSIAHDFGKALNSGGHLSSLRRTKIGEYNVDNAVTPANFKEMLDI
ncbi:MAG: tRNA pseudouridine(55) synthase TruB [Eudoraea sp.]|nr:tRNA pseudouridine(55) synthase TruB [Eudoraea sp.]MBT8292643.1 tRNA pseudouridine(55) synthase TruB [Eudoraea sp.]NNL01029.1 tRNA pseudouridine(55) synthase TruB [Eudoraea sp.]